MSSKTHQQTVGRPKARKLLACVAMAAACLLALPSLASAAYEQVGQLANNGEADQFSEGLGSGAVNVAGAGGVEPGSVYYSARGSIVRYSPAGEFKEAWGWGVTKNSGHLNEQYERCGPALGSECYARGHTIRQMGEEEITYCGAATDPAGDLYVVDREGSGRVYGPDGALLTEFKFPNFRYSPEEREICDLAVDSNGSIYAMVRQVGSNAPVRGNLAEIQKIEPVGGEYPPTAATKYATGSTVAGGGVLAAATGYGIGALAIDPANQHLYATEAAGNEVQIFKMPTEPFKLRCEGHETATLPASASEMEIKAALEAAPVSCGTVKVSSEIVSGIYGSRGVVFGGALEHTRVGRLEVLKAGGDEEATELAVGSAVPHISVYEGDGTRVGAQIDPGISGASYYGIGVYGANGDIYVADQAHAKAYVLDPSGSPRTEITGSGCEKGSFGTMEDPTLAVDQSNGNVLVSDIAAHGVVDEFDSSGSCLLSIDHPFSEAAPSAIALDNSGGANDRVAYVTSKNGNLSSVYAYGLPSGSARAPLPGLSHETVGGFYSPKGIAIDQQTGYVYVYNKQGRGGPAGGLVRRHDLVEAFSADGSELIAHFGDAGEESEDIDSGPAKIHGDQYVSGIAVDESGKVYVADAGQVGNNGRENRAMCFRPTSPGEYSHYAYCGRSQDVNVEGRAERFGIDGAGNLYVGTETTINEFSTTEPSGPLCTYATRGQGVGMTVDPGTGEVFYFAIGDQSVHLLGPCDPEKGRFEDAQTPVILFPVTTSISALAFNPSYAWAPRRPAGVVYAAESGQFYGEYGTTYVLAPAEGLPPVVESESVARTTVGSSILQARINPRGSATRYAFQYLTEAQYEANEPNERQALSVSAAGGLFGLGFEGRRLGGMATVDLAAGSTQATGLLTAAGTVTLKAAKGTANLRAAVGAGTVIAGSEKITAISASEGSFSSGQVISGAGIPAGTKITAVSGSELTLSAPASASGANTPLRAGSLELTAVSASEGEFEEGMEIEGPGIPEGATIVAISHPISGLKLTLSVPVTKPGTHVEMKAGQRTLESLSVSDGHFEPGTPIAGAGIAAGTTITAVHPDSLQISQAPTKSGTAVAISSQGPAPLAVGESVEGPGIPAGTKILAAEAGKLTLSARATSNQSESPIFAGLAFDAGAAEVQAALEGLATIGKGRVKVSGGPGDASGSTPYQVEFTGALENQDLPELEAEGTGLGGGSATVTTVRDGGEGFAHGASETPAGGGAIDPSGAATAVISGLSPETAYRFRVLATSHCNGPEAAPCEDLGGAASFSTFPETAAGLPDSRAYELVSPAEKQGGEVFPADPWTGSCRECKPPGAALSGVLPMQSSPDGSSVSYMGFPFSDENARNLNSYISSRGAEGWQTTAMSPKLIEQRAGGPAYNSSLEEGVIYQGSETQLLSSPPAPVGYPNLYLQRTAAPAALSPLIERFHYRGADARVSYVGHAGDFSAQYFTANDALTGAATYAPEPPDPGREGSDLYESREGWLSLVNVLPGNTEVAVGAAFASGSPDTHAIAADGRRVFWHVGSTLYMREDNRTTREIHHPGTFLTASPDGLEVLLSDGCLYSLETNGCIDLTQGQGGFLGVAGQSEGLSRIYFADTAALTPEAEAGSCQVAYQGGTAGEEQKEGKVPPGYGCNLYLYEAGVGTRFIATLGGADGSGGSGPVNDWAAEPGKRTAEASPDGRYLAFGSYAQLTRYAGAGSVNEVFLYDSTTGRLTCPSCSPTGEVPLGKSTLRRIQAAPSWLPQPRYLTDQGRLFFDSSDRLSPLDTNGAVEDVYEAEPAGLGSCARAAGCVSLISPGTGAQDSNFLAMNEGGEGSEAGSNVFFTTRERLTLADTDELIDLYDARVDGGLASETETQRAECQGESCQPVSQAPSDPTPASSAFHGAGNLSEAKGKAKGCAKGKVKKKGKCVKRHQKAHHKTHHKKHKRANANRRGHR